MAKGYPDFEGGKVKLFTVADWAALEATDKTFEKGFRAQDPGDIGTLSYAVPSGVTLYITYFAIAMFASLTADGDNNQICKGSIRNSTDVVDFAIIGGNGGAIILFNKPVVVEGGDTIAFDVTNYSNHIGETFVSAGGYEI